MRTGFPTKSVLAISILAGFGAFVFGTFAARAAMVFSRNFSDAAPNTGSVAGAQFGVIGGNIDIVGVLDGKIFSCAGNAGGKSTTGMNRNLIAGRRYTISCTAVLQGFTGTTPTKDYSVNLGSTETVDPIGAPFSSAFLTGAPETGVTRLSSIANLDVHGPVLSENGVTDSASVAAKPLFWAMTILGFAGVGFIAYRRRN